METEEWEMMMRRLDTQQALHEDRKAACRSSHDCSVMETYVDDTQLDGEPEWR